MKRWWCAAFLLLPVSRHPQAPLESGVYTAGTIDIRRRPTTDLAALDIQRVTLAAHASVHAERRHGDVEELVIVTAGSLRVTLGDRRRVIGPGSVTVILPGDDHRLENDGAAPLTCYVFTYRSKAPMNKARGDSAGGSFVVDWNDVRMDTSAIGGRRDIFDRPTAMFSRFEMHASTLNEGLTNHPAHTHRAEEFVLMLKGDVRMLVGAEHVTATVGDLVFLAAQISHSLDNTGRGQAEYFAFQGQ